MTVARDIQILLVEPDSSEAHRAAAILRKSRVRSHVTIVSEPAQALAHLRREANHYRHPRPSLIVLSADSLPEGGQTLLAEIKQDAKSMHIPVLFLSSSEAETDVAKAYDLDANCYLRKPLDAEQLDRALEITRDFWLTIAKLPVE